MLIKYTVISSSLYDERQELIEHSIAKARQTKIDGWDKLGNDHQQAWTNIWKEMDVVIEGDPEAQQGIRYNIFQLCQTYRGDDPRLNIGPKGFTLLCIVLPTLYSEGDCEKSVDIPL